MNSLSIMWEMHTTAEACDYHSIGLYKDITIVSHTDVMYEKTETRDTRKAESKSYRQCKETKHSCGSVNSYQISVLRATCGRLKAFELCVTLAWLQDTETDHIFVNMCRATTTTSLPPPPPSGSTGLIVAAVCVGFVVITLIFVPTMVISYCMICKKRVQMREQQEVRRSTQAIWQQRQNQSRHSSSRDAVPATFDWHHSIRVDNSLPPTYTEAEKLPPLEEVPKRKTQQWSGGRRKELADRTPLVSGKIVKDKEMGRCHEMSVLSNDSPQQTTDYGATN